MDMLRMLDALIEFDAAQQEVRQKQEKIATLRSQCAKKCGNCWNWMKSSYCPAEHNVNGQQRGPSMGDMRATYCSKFRPDEGALKATAALAELERAKEI